MACDSGRGGGGGGGAFRKFDTGPPERVIPLGYFDYSCQDDLVCKVTIEDVPYFNAPIFLENKEQIGKIDEIFGNLRDYYVTVKLGDNMKASSFQSQQKVGAKRRALKERTNDSVFCFSYSSTRVNYCHCIDSCRNQRGRRDPRGRDRLEAWVAHAAVEDEAAADSAAEEVRTLEHGRKMHSMLNFCFPVGI